MLKLLKNVLLYIPLINTSLLFAAAPAAPSDEAMLARAIQTAQKLNKAPSYKAAESSYLLAQKLRAWALQDQDTARADQENQQCYGQLVERLERETAQVHFNFAQSFISDVAEAAGEEDAVQDSLEAATQKSQALVKDYKTTTAQLTAASKRHKQEKEENERLKRRLQLLQSQQKQQALILTVKK